MSFKDLHPEKKRLYRMAYERGLTQFHFTAALILREANGYACAENYLLNFPVKGTLFQKVEHINQASRT